MSTDLHISTIFTLVLLASFCLFVCLFLNECLDTHSMFVWTYVCVSFHCYVVYVYTSALYVRFCDLWCECGTYYATLCQFCGCVLRGVIVVLPPNHWHAYIYIYAYMAFTKWRPPSGVLRRPPVKSVCRRVLTKQCALCCSKLFSGAAIHFSGVFVSTALCLFYVLPFSSTRLLPVTFVHRCEAFRIL